MTARNPEYEQAFLGEAARLANYSQTEFIERAFARLELGQEMYGDRWTELGHEQLVREMSEEAQDIACWGVLAAQSLGHDHPATEPLLRAIAWAVAAYEEISVARRLIRNPTATPSRAYSDADEHSPVP